MRKVFAIARLICAGIVCLLGIGIATLGLAFSNRGASENASDRTLTSGQRVAYQRAIEEVYWRHRIWPKENRSPKPALDAVISQAQIERKVEDCVRKSQLVAEKRRGPITGEVAVSAAHCYSDSYANAISDTYGSTYTKNSSDSEESTNATPAPVEDELAE